MADEDASSSLAVPLGSNRLGSSLTVSLRSSGKARHLQCPFDQTGKVRHLSAAFIKQVGFVTYSVTWIK